MSQKSTFGRFAAILSAFELIDAEGKYYRYAPETATRPLTDLFERILIKSAGVVQAAQLALQHGFCFSFTGGAHHAQHDFGNGFCLINDVVIAPRKLQFEKKVDRVWIIDVDAHKGDGTAALTAGDDSIRTLSIHIGRRLAARLSGHACRRQAQPFLYPERYRYPR